MEWHVTVSVSALDDVRWFGKKQGRWILRELDQQLSKDPVTATRNLKKLRPNPVAQWELRLAGKYRVLFNVDEKAAIVSIILVGEKRGNRLIVCGEEFEAHHESDTAE